MKFCLIDYDLLYLSIAFSFAKRGYFTTSPNPNVGCLIVRNHRIIGYGYHFCTGGDHAEIYALRMAGNLACGSTAYLTLEPCTHQGKTPPCVFALIKSGVRRVVISMKDPNPYVCGRGLYYLRRSGIKVRYGLMLSQAEILNQGFLKRMRCGLPRIRVKLASSLDGKIAMHSGESKWITSIEARRDVQKFRAESDVILSTSVTILFDNPRLDVRWSCLPDNVKNIYPKDEIRQPLRVIIDSANRVRPHHRVITSPGNVLLACINKDKFAWPKSVKHILLPVIYSQERNYVDLLALMKQLARYEINNVFVEAGATLFNALLNLGLVDELVLYQANKFLGINARSLYLLPGMKYLNEVVSFTLLNFKRVGPDMRLCLKPNVM